MHLIPVASNFSRIGYAISGVTGARTPRLLIPPSKIKLTPIAQGTPTQLAIALGPLGKGSPNFCKVVVINSYKLLNG
jgi:hypothetical protein